MNTNSGRSKHSKNKNQIKYMKIRQDELEFIDNAELLGRGQFGDVRRAKWNGSLVAVKEFQSADARCGFWDELFYLVRLKHEHIVKLHGAYPDKKKPYIVMEYAHNSLAKVLHGVNLQYEYNIHHVIFWSLQLALGLQYIHLCNLIHRDVKSSNVLLFDTGHELKLCDFGTATKIEHTLTNGVGTVRYMAPEVIKGKHYSKQVDVFSFAVVLWEMLSRKIPLLQADGEGEENHLSVLYAIATGARPPKIHGIPKFFSTMIERCWDEAPEKRPSIDELVLKFTKLSKGFNKHEPLLRKNVYGKHVSYDPAKVKHLSSLTSHSQPFASLHAKLSTQVTKVPTQVENPNYVSPANTGSNSATAATTEGRNNGNQSREVPVATGKAEDVKNTEEEPMSVGDEQPATLTPAESLAIPAPGQPKKMKADDDNKAVSFSIGPSQQQQKQTSQVNVGTPHTNADEPKGSSAQPKPLKIPTSSAIFQTNADIPQEMAAGPPFSAPPTPAHRQHAQTVGKQFSHPQFSNISEALDESQHIYSQFSETGPKDEYKSHVSVIDLPSGIDPALTQKVSMEDEAIMQRQQQRFKMIEEQNKTKSLQFKQYSDPYSYKSTERVQSKQRRAQGSFNYPKAHPGSKHHITGLDTELQPIVPIEGNEESEKIHEQYKKSAQRLVTARQEFTEVQLRLQSLDEQVEQHEKYKALVDKAEHLMEEHTRLQGEINKLNSGSN